MLIPLSIEKTFINEDEQLIIVTSPMRPCFIGKHISELKQSSPCKGVFYVGPLTEKAGHYPQCIVVDFSKVETEEEISFAPFVIWLNAKPFTILQNLLQELIPKEE